MQPIYIFKGISHAKILSKIADFEKKKTSKFARFLQEVPVTSQECKRMPANPHFYFHLWFIAKFG
jgi:hypothetical protein